MAVLTKTKKRQQLPRCESITAAGSRCRFHGTQYVGGQSICSQHAASKVTHDATSFVGASGGSLFGGTHKGIAA